MWFVYRPLWFALAQTDGQRLDPAPTPLWDAARALSVLDVQEAAFESLDGNTLGYARARTIAVNPVNALPHKTRFHELAHVLLGHTSEGEQHDGDLTPRSLRDAKRKQSPCSVAPHWACPASSIHAATFRHGGGRAMRFPRSPHNGC